LVQLAVNSGSWEASWLRQRGGSGIVLLNFWPRYNLKRQFRGQRLRKILNVGSPDPQGHSEITYSEETAHARNLRTLRGGPCQQDVGGAEGGILLLGERSARAAAGPLQGLGAQSEAGERRRPARAPFHPRRLLTHRARTRDSRTCHQQQVAL